MNNKVFPFNPGPFELSQLARAAEALHGSVQMQAVCEGLEKLRIIPRAPDYRGYILDEKAWDFLNALERMQRRIYYWTSYKPLEPRAIRTVKAMHRIPGSFQKYLESQMEQEARELAEYEASRESEENRK